VREWEGTVNESTCKDLRSGDCSRSGGMAEEIEASNRWVVKQGGNWRRGAEGKVKGGTMQQLLSCPQKGAKSMFGGGMSTR